MPAPTLEEKYVARTGSPILRDLMLIKIEQAMVEYAALIAREGNPSAARKDFAAMAIMQTEQALPKILPYITANPAITDPALKPDNKAFTDAVKATVDQLYPAT